jgi:hypothetical protein
MEKHHYLGTRQAPFGLSTYLGRWRSLGVLALLLAFAIAPNSVTAATKKAKPRKVAARIPKLAATTSQAPTSTAPAAIATVSTTISAETKPAARGYDENIAALLQSALQNGAKVAYAGYGAGSSEGIIQYNVSFGARCVLSSVVTTEDPLLPGLPYSALALTMDDRFYAAPKKLDSLIQGYTITATERGTKTVGMGHIWGKVQLGPNNDHPLDAVIGHVTNRGMFTVCNRAALEVPASSWVDSEPTENTIRFEKFIRRMADSSIAYVDIVQGFLTSANGIDVNPYSIIGIGCKGQKTSNRTGAPSSIHSPTVTAAASKAGAISVSIDMYEFGDKSPAFVTARALFNKDTDPFAQSIRLVEDLSNVPQFAKADGTLATVCSARP